MAETEEDVKRLENIIAILETKLLGMDPREKHLLRDTVSNLKQRLDDIQKKVKEKEEQEQAQRRYNVEVAQAMQRETGLTAEEKGVFGNFLQKEFFTKQDFHSLEQFYSKSYDRLTEQGKDQMDHRVWEGIRRNEFKFEELPSAIRERISNRIYQDISKDSNRISDVKDIPDKDRTEFMEAYRSGNKQEAYNILDRPGFKKTIAVRENVSSQSDQGQNKVEVPANSTHTSMSSEAEHSSASLNKKIPASLNLASKGIESITSVSNSENKAPPTVHGNAQEAVRSP